MKTKRVRVPICREWCHTEPGANYPAYINVKDSPNGYVVTVRATPACGIEGATAVAIFPVKAFQRLLNSVLCPPAPGFAGGVCLSGDGGLCDGLCERCHHRHDSCPDCGGAGCFTCLGKGRVPMMFVPDETDVPAAGDAPE